MALLIPPFTGIPSLLPVSATALHMAHCASAFNENTNVNTAMKIRMLVRRFTVQKYSKEGLGNKGLGDWGSKVFGYPSKELSPNA